MGFFANLSTVFSAYQYTGNPASPGWPEGWFENPEQISPSTPVVHSQVEQQSVSSVNVVSSPDVLGKSQQYYAGDGESQVVTFSLPAAVLTANPGDWVFYNPNTKIFSVVTPEQFQDNFVEVVGQ